MYIARVECPDARHGHDARAPQQAQSRHCVFWCWWGREWRRGIGLVQIVVRPHVILLGDSTASRPVVTHMICKYGCRVMLQAYSIIRFFGSCNGGMQLVWPREGRISACSAPQGSRDRNGRGRLSPQRGGPKGIMRIRGTKITPHMDPGAFPFSAWWPQSRTVGPASEPVEGQREPSATFRLALSNLNLK